MEIFKFTPDINHILQNIPNQRSLFLESNDEWQGLFEMLVFAWLKHFLPCIRLFQTYYENYILVHNTNIDTLIENDICKVGYDGQTQSISGKVTQSFIKIYIDISILHRIKAVKSLNHRIT